MEKNGKKKNHANGKHKKSAKEYKVDDEIDTFCCFCVKTKRSQKKSLIAGCVTNLGIFAVLLAYTLVGAVMFLAIEGSAMKAPQQTLATTSLQPAPALNASMAAELRAQTVESIWEITVSLNILYKENWTRLAAQEIARFQERLAARVSASPLHAHTHAHAHTQPMLAHYEWDFPKAFLYSLTVLTTVGYGAVAPRTALGKAVTVGYAVVGIPLTLLYLSVVGALLSRLARHALCCRAVPSPRATRTPPPACLHEPYYVRSSSGTIMSASQANTLTPTSVKDKSQSLSFLRDCDSTSCTDTESKISLASFSIFVPISLCLTAIFLYIFFGAFVLYQLEGWSPVDGIYFCFMSLSTIGFGHLTPGASDKSGASNGTIWFCSAYIVAGLALTAMCFNVMHDEIVHRLRHHDKLNKPNGHKDSEYLHRS